MKLRAAAGVFAAAVGVVAQSSSYDTMSASNYSATPVTVVMTIDDCDTTTSATMVTVTNGVTVTYCPACEMMSSSAAAAASASPAPAPMGHTTVYTTVYQSLCTTGSTWYTTPQVYTVTESCTGTTPSWSSGNNYIPQGYTTTVMDCAMCESTESVTITKPCGCTEGGSYATTPTPAPAGSPASGASNAGATPVQQISDGQVQNPAGSTAAAPGQPPANQNPTAPGSAGAPATSMPASTTTVGCPGPQCRGASTNAPSTGPSLEPFTGSADALFAPSLAGLLGSMAACAIGCLAIML